MARTRITQNSMIVGVIAPTLLGRQDLDKYFSAVEEAENVVIQPHGGMKRRGGLKSGASVITGSRLFSFEFSLTQNYIFVMSITNFKVYLPTDVITPVATVVWTTPPTQTQLNDMDIIQSADTIIITHEDFSPLSIQRQGSDASWLEETITLENIPKFDFTVANKPDYFNYGTSSTVTVQIDEIVYNNDLNAVNGLDEHLYKAKTLRSSIDLSTEDYTVGANWTDLGVREDVWSSTHGWPRTTTFHQGRLWFGGSKDKPTSVWGSVTNDFFNFDTGRDDVQADSAIFDVLDTDQYNAIVNIISSRNLQAITAGGEFTNASDIITPTDSQWVAVTGYGGKRVKPVTLDGATYYMDKFGKTVRGLIFTFEEGSYTSPPISILSEHIINNVVDLDIVRGSSISVANLLYLVNTDGTVAVFNTMRQENINGWTKWTTNGTFKRVTVTQEQVSFIVEREGTEFLEVLDETLLLDHAFSDTSTDRVEADAVLVANEIRVVADDITQTAIATVNEGGTDYGIADRTADNIYIGLNYTVIIKTLPVTIETKAKGNIVNLPKRVTRAILTLDQSRGVYVNDNLVTSRKFGQPTDTVFPLVTGIESIYLLGYNSKTQIEITQKNPDPMTVLAIDLEISW